MPKEAISKSGEKLNGAAWDVRRKRCLSKYRGQFTTQVYLMWCPATKMVKIGISSNVEKRRSGIQGSCGSEVILARCSQKVVKRSAREYEDKLHRFFKKHRKLGEWFDDCIYHEAKFYIDCIKRGGVYRRKYRPAIHE